MHKKEPEEPIMFWFYFYGNLQEFETYLGTPYMVLKIKTKINNENESM